MYPVDFLHEHTGRLFDESLRELIERPFIRLVNVGRAKSVITTLQLITSDSDEYPALVTLQKRKHHPPMARWEFSKANLHLLRGITQSFGDACVEVSLRKTFLTG